MEKKVLIERWGPVTVLTLNRPEVRNCIDAETAGLLSEAIERFAADREANVMVVTGAGERAFCAGADLKDIAAIVDRSGGTRRAPLGFSDVEPGKPRIAAVEGWAAGGGIELACWCDFAVAGASAVFAALNRRVGVPWVDGGTQRMTRRSGVGNALYVLERGEEIDARRALARALELAEGEELAEGVRRFWERRGEGPRGRRRGRRPSSLRRPARPHVFGRPSSLRRRRFGTPPSRSNYTPVVRPSQASPGKEAPGTPL